MEIYVPIYKIFGQAMSSAENAEHGKGGLGRV